MKKILLILSSIILILTLTTTGFAKNQHTQSNSRSTYLIAFHSEIDKNIVNKYGGEVKRKFKFMPAISANLPEKAVESLANNPKIKYIEKDAKVHINAQITPWGISHVSGIEAHDLGYTGKGIKVGILDSGINYTHEDLNVIDGISFVPGITDYMDDNGHGTHVAGIIGGLDNDIGVIGLSPDANIYGIILECC